MPNNWKEYAKIALFGAVIIIASMAAYQLWFKPSVDEIAAKKAGALTA